MTRAARELAMHELTELGTLIAAREVTSREITEAQLKRISLLDRSLHAYALVLETAALAQADAADQEMPIGLQLVAGHFQEATLLRAGAAFQAVTAWHQRHPAFPMLYPAYGGRP